MSLTAPRTPEAPGASETPDAGDAVDPANAPDADPASPRGVRNRMAVWGLAHAVDDMYQGLVPASVPYFVLERHYSYLAASGLTLAATLGSALPQPAIGLAVDRWRLPRRSASRSPGRAWACRAWRAPTRWSGSAS